MMAVPHSAPRPAKRDTDSSTSGSSSEEWASFCVQVKRGMSGSEAEKEDLLRRRLLKFFHSFSLERDRYYVQRREVAAGAQLQLSHNTLLLYGIDFLAEPKIERYFHPYEVCVDFYDDSHCSVSFRSADQLLRAVYARMQKTSAMVEDFPAFCARLNSNYEKIVWRELEPYYEMCFERVLWFRFLTSQDFQNKGKIGQTAVHQSYLLAKDNFFKDILSSLDRVAPQHPKPPRRHYSSHSRSISQEPKSRSRSRDYYVNNRKSREFVEENRCECHCLSKQLKRLIQLSESKDSHCNQSKCQKRGDRCENRGGCADRRQERHTERQHNRNHRPFHSNPQPQARNISRPSVLPRQNTWVTRPGLHRHHRRERGPQRRQRQPPRRHHLQPGARTRAVPVRRRLGGGEVRAAHRQGPGREAPRGLHRSQRVQHVQHGRGEPLRHHLGIMISHFYTRKPFPSPLFPCPAGFHSLFKNPQQRTRGVRQMTMKLGKSLSEEQPDRKMQELREKKKPVLLKELENELKHLDEMDDEDYTNDPEPELKDVTLKRLQMIYKEAAKLEIKEIEKLSRLAIGKRILNIELKRRKDEHNAKLRKKETIELFFRENRIKKVDFNSMIEEGLKHSTFIVRPNENGKGFIESDKPYKSTYSKALMECEFLKTIREVNKIFYVNYSGVDKNSISLSETLLKVVWIPLTLFLIMGISLPFVSFQYEEVVLLTLLAAILAIMFYVIVRTFKTKPTDNNQIEQSICDVREHFEKLNAESDLKGTNIEWRVSNDFMHLEVIFHNGFPG